MSRVSNFSHTQSSHIEYLFRFCLVLYVIERVLYCISVCKWYHLFYISLTVRLHPGSTKPLHFITITHYPPASATIPHLHTPAASFSSQTLPALLSLNTSNPFFFSLSRTETLHANMLTWNVKADESKVELDIRVMLISSRSLTFTIDISGWGLALRSRRKTLFVEQFELC